MKAKKKSCSCVYERKSLFLRISIITNLKPKEKMKTRFSETSKGKLTSGKVVIAKSITTLTAVPALALGVLLMLGSCSGKTEKTDKADADSTAVVQDTTKMADNAEVNKEAMPEKETAGKGDLRLFDLVGKVKKCKLKSRYDTTTSWEFDENGMWTKLEGKALKAELTNIKKDSNGRIIGYTQRTEEMEWSTAYTFDKSTGRLKELHVFGSGEDARTTYTYNDAGDMVKIIEKGTYEEIGADEPENYSETITYTIEAKDEAGNWTKRKCKSSNGESFTETRTIEYYN